MRTNEPEPEMIRVEFRLDGCRQRETVEIEADKSYEEVEKAWKEWAWSFIDGGFERLHNPHGPCNCEGCQLLRSQEGHL